MKLSKQELIELCNLAEVAAKAAGQYIQSQFEANHEQRIKEDGGDTLASQVVTQVDIKAQEIILNFLMDSIKKFDIGILTEEAKDNHSRLTKEYFWCIDPMDGTLPFLEGRTGYAVSIALINRAGDPIIGVVYIPDLDECFSSVQGIGLLLNRNSYARETDSVEETLHFFMDQSMKKEPYYQEITNQLETWTEEHEVSSIVVHDSFGAVRNAIGVLRAEKACYFKFPKPRLGGGCIWDYAATRLFFEEFQLSVSNISGEALHLNNPDTAFMNQIGILYATDPLLSTFIQSCHHEWKASMNQAQG